MLGNYLAGLSPLVREYYGILEPDFPEWLVEYIETPAMQSQGDISVTCGTIYSELYNDAHYPFSSLDHSVGVALIVWHFTHDKKQTLAGLFHDIATPAFKHCVDFLNGDYLTQESTEDLTTEIIKSSREIMRLLERDGISVEEVDNYHLYPIADNDTPQLSADRLEYSLSNGAIVYQIKSLDDVSRFYKDLCVQKNGDGEDEIVFKHKTVARDFVEMTSRLSIIYRDDRTRFSMQFVADILKNMSKDGLIEKSDLYQMGDAEIMGLIEVSDYAEEWRKWRMATGVKTSKTVPGGGYLFSEFAGEGEVYRPVGFAERWYA